VAPVFAPPIQLAGADPSTEPRIAIGGDGRRWLAASSTMLFSQYSGVPLPSPSFPAYPTPSPVPGPPDLSSSSSAMVVYESDDGLSWHATGALPGGQQEPTIDVDIVVEHTGRIVASELDFSGPRFVTSYSDDGGATWTQSVGTGYADQDRQWLAVGPDDPSTGLPRVYLLFHDLFSGAVQHNMFVATSRDGGATFGPPVPTTLPGDPAYADLQCADSGGPSSLSVNQRTGQIYAVFGTRSSVVGPLTLGGCGASVVGPFEENVVAATRAWVVTSMDGSAGSWRSSLAVDDAPTNQIIGMQLSPGTLDDAGNLYVAYPESAHAYPDYSGAAVKLVWADPSLDSWSKPVTVAAGGQPGHTLVHIAAGDPGKVDLAYFAGEGDPGNPRWYMELAQSLDAQAPAPTFTHTRLARFPVYQGTASKMMGACQTMPPGEFLNGYACNRSTDVWGIALDPRCNATVTWPVDRGLSSVPGVALGTFVSQQTGGSTLCAGPRTAAPAVASSPSPTASPAPAASPTVGARPLPRLPNTQGGGALPLAALLLLLALVAGGTLARRQVSR
jgi:hypothetical protein